jgi:hypothetical protein
VKPNQGQREQASKTWESYVSREGLADLWKPTWGPDGQRFLKATIADCAEHATALENSGKEARQVRDARFAARTIESWAQSMNTAVQLIGTPEAVILESICNQWQNITGDDPKIATGTASRDVNTKWALDGGWLKGTAATNAAIACSIGLYEQTQKGWDGTEESVNGGSTQFGEKSRRKIWFDVI